MLNVIEVGCQVAGTAPTNVTPAAPGSVTSVVTTGPDGAPLDEGSQQSTLSNASAGMYVSVCLKCYELVVNKYALSVGI